MLPTGKKLYFRNTPIARVSSLALHLSIPQEELIQVADSVKELWMPGKQLKKKNGEPRITFDAKPQLKKIHEKIKERLLKQVEYPRYLLGGIADNKFTRDYKQHAQVHSGQKYLIEEDIKDFFPSTSVDIVRAIWQHFFHFSPEVTEILTKLTTLNGSLPQGWKTSGYLANLAFWDKEYLLVEALNKQGYTYSRFMDDISVSSGFKLQAKHKTFVVSEIYSMLYSTGYMPKRSKHEIHSASECMKVTGLIVNSKKPTLTQEDKNNIRAAVHECQKHSEHDRISHAYKKKWGSVSGRVGKLKQFHPDKAEKFRKILTDIKPVISQVSQ